AVSAVEHVPDHIAVRASDHGYIGLAVAVIITSDRLITGLAKAHGTEGLSCTVDPIPGTRLVTPNTDVALAVAVKIAGGDEVFIGDTETLVGDTAAGKKCVPGII